MKSLGENGSVMDKVESVQMGQQLLNRVPQITIYFWIILITVTTLGEKAADFLSNNMNFGIINTTIILSILLITMLYLQFRVKKYIAIIYWLIVILMSTVGTQGSNFLAVTSSIKVGILIALLAISFLMWYLREGTLSIHSINTAKREAFYWLVILLSFALGKAAGDWISEMLRLNSISFAIMYAAAIGIVTLAHLDYKLNLVFAFWITYILTSPFGNILSNFLSKPFSSGGIGLGEAGANLVFLLIIVSLMIYLSIKSEKTKQACGLEKVYQRN
jgi:uncharacterized membrane-anchored protein